MKQLGAPGGVLPRQEGAGEDGAAGRRSMPPTGIATGRCRAVLAGGRRPCPSREHAGAAVSHACGCASVRRLCRLLRVHLVQHVVQLSVVHQLRVKVVALLALLGQAVGVLRGPGGGRGGGVEGGHSLSSAVGRCLSRRSAALLRFPAARAQWFEGRHALHSRAPAWSALPLPARPPSPPAGWR